MVQASRHQCLIYEGSPSAYLSRLVPTFLTKLDDRHRCLFLGSSSMVARMHADLADAGLNVSDHMRSGALILTSDRGHLIHGEFDTRRMLTLLSDMVKQALAEGYKGLLATGDMTWEFGTKKNLAKLLEYECGLERLFRTQPALVGICQYHKDTLPLDMIGNALYTHRTVYINHTLQRVNPYYLQPENLVTQKPPRLMPAEIETMFRAATGQN